MAKEFPNTEQFWKPGESGNPGGRPKKSFTIINDRLKAEGYTPLKKAELIEAYALIFNCDQDRLKELVNEPDLPYALKIIIMELNNKSYRSRALRDYRDYMFGTAVTEVKWSEQPIYPDRENL